MRRILKTAGSAIQAFFMPGNFDGQGMEVMDDRRETIDNLSEAQRITLFVAVAVSGLVLGFIAALALSGRI